MNVVSEADALSCEERSSGVDALSRSMIVDIGPMVEVDVPADGFEAFQLEVPSAKASFHLTGRVEVIGGANKDIEVFRVSPDDYTNLWNENAFRAYFGTLRTSVVSLD